LNYSVFAPEILMLITASVVLFGEWAFKGIGGSKEKKNANIGFFTLIGMFVTLGVLFAFKATSYTLAGSFYYPEAASYFNSFILDDYALFFKIIIVISAILTVMISFRYVNDRIDNVGEFYSLVCMATMGAMFVASANEMITLYLSIELLSISSYILCCFNKDKDKSSESGLKYFIVGALSSALLLYGFSIMFGLTGTTQFSQLAAGLGKFSQPLNSVFIIAIVLTLAGLGYKIAAAPFHMWAPDVYQGAPTPVTAFLSITSKIAGFAAVSRFLQVFNYDVAAKLVVLISVISVLTMCIGNFLSLTQTNIKRLFAYSSIAHAGYLLMGIIPLLSKGRSEDFASVLFYLVAYTFMNIGCFAAILYFSKYTGSTEISDFAGVARKAPFIAFVFSCCLISLAGLPPFGGFTGKFYLFMAAVNSGYTWLAFVGALNSVISLYYYVKIIKVMYFAEPKEGVIYDMPNAALAVAVAISLVGILTLFLAPFPFMEMAKISTFGL
jgi:proton-translocating NADH-quinone oxidoreductase chain N